MTLCLKAVLSVYCSALLPTCLKAGAAASIKPAVIPEARPSNKISAIITGNSALSNWFLSSLENANSSDLEIVVCNAPAANPIQNAPSGGNSSAKTNVIAAEVAPAKNPISTRTDKGIILGPPIADAIAEQTPAEIINNAIEMVNSITSSCPLGSFPLIGSQSV